MTLDGMVQTRNQFSFQHNEKGDRCVIFEEDTITKTNDGGLGSLRKDWINPNKTNVNCCPVCLIDKYMSLLPPPKNDRAKHNFYLCSMERPNPAQWYTSQVVGLNTLKKTVGHLLKDAKLDRFFTNHSLRCSTATCLFRAGVDKKLIREITGHRSYALDKYEETSHSQRKHISDVLAGNCTENVTKRSDEKDECKEVEVTVSQEKHSK